MTARGAHAGRPPMLGRQRAGRVRIRATPDARPPAPPPPTARPPTPSSWNAKEAKREGDGAGGAGGGGEGRDYLHELGAAQEYNINVDHGQTIDHLDSVFLGNDVFALGTKSDIADGSLRRPEFREFANGGEFHINARFLDAVGLHIAKNILADQGVFDDKVRIPTILGVWGGKGMGKTFQVEQALKRMGALAVVMSAGEMEDEWAGVPGQRIRERYRAASELGRIRGKPVALVINDIDAGAGAFANTQRTVNTQIVSSTLMNLCDDPNHVPGPGDWRADDTGGVPWHGRVPVIVTANDLSVVFAPLLRDGRMDKFLWAPSREDLVEIVGYQYRDDPLVSTPDIEALLDAFPGQSLDFYGAIRSGTADNGVRAWIASVVGDLTADGADMAPLASALLAARRAASGDENADAPEIELAPVTLDALLAEGARLAAEQDHVNSHKLSADYLPDTGGAGGLLGLSGNYVDPDA